MAVFFKQVINILPILITAVLLPFDVSAASIAQKVYCGPGQQLEEGLEDANEHVHLAHPDSIKIETITGKR